MAQPVNKILKALFDIKPVDEAGRVDVAKIGRVQPVVDLGTLNKETPEKGASFRSFKTRSLCSKTALTPRLLSSYSRTSGLSTDSVDKLEAPVDPTGLAPVTLGVKTRYLLHNTTGPLPGLGKDYQKQIKKQNPAKLLEKYLNSKLSIKKELTAIGAKVEKGGAGGKPRIRPIFANRKLEIMNNELGITNQDHNSLFKIQDSESNEGYQTVLAKISEKVKPNFDEVSVGEPKKIDPFEYWNQNSLTTSSRFYSPFRIKDLRFVYDESGQVEEQITRESEPKVLKSLKTQIYGLGLDIGRRFAGGFNKKVVLAISVAALSALIFASFGQYGISVKNEVIKESDSAVANLEQAHESLKGFDFKSASNNFAEAYGEFSKAGDNLNFMGSGLTSLFAELPGFNKLTAGGAGKLKSAKNLVEAGKLLSEAGKSMSEAVSSLSRTGAILKLSTLTTYDVGSVNDFGDLKKSLLSSEKNLSKASVFLSDVSADALPENRREAFLEFKSRLPELESVVSDAVEYTNFMERFLGVGLTTSDGQRTSDVSARKYLILFQNNSELRPTGGFPGTYAVVTFEDGRLAPNHPAEAGATGLAGFLVDDVYNLDGQLKEDVIPPKPLQHITPNWGMRDANWFIDFSVSAQKIIQFYEMATREEYEDGPARGKTPLFEGSSADHAQGAGRTSNGIKKEAGYGIDGVITMSPRMITDILKVVGPIEMPEYGLTINNENFLATIQAEVEYGDNRQQPKRVILDMAPRLLEKIYSSDPGQWLDIFNVFVSGLDRKDILMYFKDLNLENFAAEKGFGGLIEKTDGDYLMVTFTNVKGSKTDRVTDNSIKLESRVMNRESRIIHKLTITRRHNGGNTKYGFYNKQNPAYVRVLVPEGSELLNISGNSNPGFAPLVSYSGTDFKQDDDLFKFESGFRLDSEKGVSTYKESGKTGFAFWLITDPGEKKTVELEYTVPINHTDNNGQGTDSSGHGTGGYGIYIQKQPGLKVDNLEFRVGDTNIYSGELEKDLELRFKTK